MFSSTSSSSSLLLSLSSAAAATTTTPSLPPEFTPKDDAVISSPTNYPGSIVTVETSAMSSISGFAFFDSKGDGNYDAITSAGISDTFVSLFTCSNDIINTTKTDGMGYYSFEKLYEGRYYINATAPQWFAFSDVWNGKTDGTTGELLNQDVGSAVNPDTGRTDCFDLKEGESETVSFALKLDIPPNPAPTPSVSSSAPTDVVAMRSPSASPSEFAKFSSLKPSVANTSSSQLPPNSHVQSPRQNVTIVEASSPPSIIFQPSQNPTSSFHPTIMPSTSPDSNFTALPGGVQKPPDGLPEESDNPKENGNAASYFAIIIAVSIGAVLVAALVLLALRRKKHRREESMETYGSNDPSYSGGPIDGDLETGLKSSGVPSGPDDISCQVSFAPPPQCKPSLMHLDAKYCTSHINIYSIADIPKITSFKILKINVIAPAGKLKFVTEKPPSGGPSYICYIRDTCPIIDRIHLDDEIVAVDEQDVRSIAGEKLSELLASKSEQAERKITLLREIRADGDGEAAISRRSPIRRLSIGSIADIPDLTSLSIIKIDFIAPAGKLGIITETSYEGGPAYVCEIKDFCPVAGQIRLEDGIIAIDDEDVRHLPGTSLRKLLVDKIDQAERKITVLRRVVDRCECPAGVEGEDSGYTSQFSVPLSSQGSNTNGTKDTSPHDVAAPGVGPGGEIKEDIGNSDIGDDAKESGTATSPLRTKRSEGEPHLMQAPSSENTSPQLVASPEIGLWDKAEEDIMVRASRFTDIDISDLGNSDINGDEGDAGIAALSTARDRTEGEPRLMRASSSKYEPLQLVAAPDIGPRDKTEEDTLFRAYPGEIGMSDLGGNGVSDCEGEPGTAALPMPTNRAEGETRLMLALSSDDASPQPVVAPEVRPGSETEEDTVIRDHPGDIEVGDVSDDVTDTFLVAEWQRVSATKWEKVFFIDDGGELSSSSQGTNDAEDTLPQPVTAPEVGPGGENKEDVGDSDTGHERGEPGITASAATKHTEGQPRLMLAPSSKDASPQRVASRKVGPGGKTEEDSPFLASLGDIGDSGAVDDGREPGTAPSPAATKRTSGDPTPTLSPSKDASPQLVAAPEVELDGETQDDSIFLDLADVDISEIVNCNVSDDVEELGTMVSPVSKKQAPPSLQASNVASGTFDENDIYAHLSAFEVSMESELLELEQFGVSAERRRRVEDPKMPSPSSGRGDN